VAALTGEADEGLEIPEAPCKQCMVTNPLD
jgi:hypothetical protein